MQTFVPLLTYRDSVLSLDYSRLRGQYKECGQIADVLQGLKRGWTNHPAILMWKECHEGFAFYACCVSDQHKQLGYKHNLRRTIESVWTPKEVYPKWWGGPIHETHRANLLRKNPGFYQMKGWTEDPNMPYFWPESIHEGKRY